MFPPTKVNGAWPFNDAWLRTSLEEARRQAPRNVASILDSARALGIRDAHAPPVWRQPNVDHVGGRRLSAHDCPCWRVKPLLLSNGSPRAVGFPSNVSPY